MSSVRSLVHEQIDRLIPIHSVKVYEPLGIANMRTEFQRIIKRHRFTLDEEFTAACDEEETEVATEDIHGLHAWVDQRENSPSTKAHFSDRGSSNHSPNAAWSEVSNPSRSHSPQSLQGMNSMEQAMYNDDVKVHHQHGDVAELPGTAMIEPWHGGLSELPATEARWYPGLSELP